MTVEKRRPRWWLGILIAVVTVGLLAGAAELALRLIIPGVVANSVRDEMGLTADHPVDVELGGFALLHAVTGRVGEIAVEVPDAQVFDGIVATLAFDARSVPFDPTHGEIQGGTASVTIPAESMDSVVAILTHGVADSAQVRGGEVVVGRAAVIFGMSVQLSVALTLAVEDGDVLIEPTAVSAAGFELSAEEIRQFAGDSLDSLLTPQTFCVRDRLPAGIALTGLELSSTGSATITADLAPGILSDPAQQATGTCSG